MSIEVGNRIKLIRKKRGETLEQFGNAIGGVLKSNVSKRERGLSLPNNERIKIIAELGDTTVQELLREDASEADRFNDNKFRDYEFEIAETDDDIKAFHDKCLGSDNVKMNREILQALLDGKGILFNDGEYSVAIVLE